jgi:hypothetical protein
LLYLTGVGDKEFAMETKAKLGAKAMGRSALENNDGYELREFQISYNHVFAPEIKAAGSGPHS